MDNQKLSEVSQKLIKVIETRDLQRVRQLTKVLERQKDPMNTVKIFWMVNHYLQQTNTDLCQWFQRIYFEDCPADVKAMWLEFVELCELSFADRLPSKSAS